MSVRPQDHIFVDSWEALCADLGGALVYRKTDEVPAFFEEIAGTGKRVILVTACNDSGLHIQAEAHPNADLFKLAASVEWDELIQMRDGYHAVNVGPAVTNGCLNAHRYSLKTDRFTWGTFEEVPSEVVWWYTTNLNCDCPRTSCIPFGLNNDGPGGKMLADFVGRPKTASALLYVNFQNNSMERVQLKRHYATQPWATFRPSADLPITQYLQEMAEHRFVLAPPGNGLDCYRIWEALYLGCIPVLTQSYFAHNLAEQGLPVLVVDNPFLLTAAALEETWQKARDTRFDWRLASLSFWKSVLMAESLNA